MNPASRSSRFFAALLDNIILGALISASSAVFAAFASPIMALLLSCVFQLVIWFFYILKPTKETGQTFGKKVLGIQIVFEDLPTMGQVMKREGLWKFVSFLTLIGLAPILFNRKSLHDHFSKTEVVTLEDLAGETAEEKDNTSSSELKWLKWIPVVAIPAFALIFMGTLLFSEIPLQALRDTFEAQGLRTENISGSIYEGIKISNLELPEEAGQFQDITLKMNLWSSLTSFSLDIEEVSVQNGWLKDSKDKVVASLTAEKSPEKSPPTPSSPPVTEEAAPKRGLPIRIGILKFANIETKSEKDSYKLHLFELQNMNLNGGKWSLGKVQFSIDKVSITAENLSYDKETSEFLANNIDIAVPAKNISMLRKDLSIKIPQLSAQQGLIIFKGTIDNAPLEANINKKNFFLKLHNLPVDQLLNTDIPLETISFSVEKKDATPLQIESTASLCGKTFNWQDTFYKNDEQGSDYILQPRLNLQQLLTKQKTSDQKESADQKKISDYVTFEFVTPNNDPSKTLDTISNFCYGTSPDQLTESQKTLIGRIEPFVPAQSSLSSSEQQGTTIANEQIDEATFLAAYEQSKELYRQGKFKESRQLNQTIGSRGRIPASIPPEKKATISRYWAWVELHHGNPQLALTFFTLLLNNREYATISDVEGLMKAYAKIGDTEKAKLYRTQIQAVIKAKPELAKELSPALRRSIASENP